MSGFDLFDAVDDPNSGSASGSNQPSWPTGPAGGAGPWGGDQSGGGGLWPGGQSGEGGMWPAGGSNPASGGWPSPAPGPAPGGWPSPAPGPAPGHSSNKSPTVPFRRNLPNGFYDGLLFNIKGVIKPNADKVAVDLCTKRDIAFHLNPRFNDGGQQVIVRNSCQSKKWGSEERSLGNFPFARGKPFEMEILCTSTEFKVSVDHSPVLTFKHRITDLRSINSLNIYKDVDLVSVEQRTQ